MERCQKHIKTQCPMPCPVCLIEERDELQAALSPFVSFKQFLDAVRELNNEKPLGPHTCIASVMGGGGSDYIWYGDLMKAEEALK